ncbi:MAG: hypothetical protein ACTSRU_12375 [Candidatus Hodarchaeales archaeon]
MVIIFIVTSINATLIFRESMDRPSATGEENINELKFQKYQSIYRSILDSLKQSNKVMLENTVNNGQTTSCDTDYLEISYFSETNSTLIITILPSLVSIGIVRKKENWFNDNTSIKDQLYETIDLNPGIHFQQFCRFLNRQNGVIQHHLWTLEIKEGRITSHQDGPQ